MPLIKGLFINSHIEWLRSQMGDEAVYELNVRLGKFDGYNALDDYPVREEVRVIETALDIVHEDIDPADRSFEAGRLHFRNFVRTTYGSMVVGLMPRTSEGFKSLLLHAAAIARFVFRNTNFTSEEVGVREVRVTMDHNDYPIDHFRGLLYEWALFWEVQNPVVTAQEEAPRRYVYTVRWD